MLMLGTASQHEHFDAKGNCQCRAPEMNDWLDASLVQLFAVAVAIFYVREVSDEFILGFIDRFRIRKKNVYRSISGR